MDSIDEVDRSLIAALEIDGRAPFNRIGEAIGVSDQTAARRYRRLRAAGVVKVVGQVDPWRIGETRWYIRIQATPDAAAQVARALADRPDTFWVQLVSGGGEINCVVQARSDSHRDQLLLHKLPRTSRVIGFSAHALLHMYFGGETQFPALVEALDEERAAALRVEVDGAAEPVPFDPADRPLVAALNRDGRAGYGELARATGWSESTCRRRLTELRRSGALYFDVDIDPAPLGFLTRAVLWLQVPPSELAAVGQSIADHPEVAFVAATTGATNLLAMVICRDTHALYDYIDGRLGSIPAIRHIETNPVIQSLKGAGQASQRA
ncbi:Lrp/AsnC family transcriptional regulator [Glycomyces arizonensis]|uniref:Lrp/AsnC family transcriptional regulator n=1 Tax=Glycomyces arizonensis TaxID=256035 RepID=UPI00040234B6|nr:AsnC family transcriptional regulator [Glycomyces arizonensis]